jgi:MFS family permease
LFTVAQYFQQGLGRGALASGLILVPWVAAFGIGGRIVRRAPGRISRVLALLEYVLLAAAYVAIGALVFAGPPNDAVLAVLLALGGLGLGTGFATLIAHLTNAVPAEYAPDISGVTTTSLQIGGTLGVAAFGSLYLGLASAGHQSPSHSFAITTLALGAMALIAAALAHHATRPAEACRPA